MKSKKSKKDNFIRLSLIAFFLLVPALTQGTEIKNKYFKTSDGITLHYLESGAGTPLVLIPGWTMPAEIWKPQIDFFSRRFRVVALDPRSQGESQVASSGHNPERRAQDIKELLDVSGKDKVVLVGWSLGVCEVLTYIKLFGESRLSAIVLVDNSIGYGLPPSGKSSLLKDFKRNRKKAAEIFVRSMYKRPHKNSYYRRITRLSLKTPLKASLSLLSTLYSREVLRDIIRTQVQVPMLYVVTPAYADQAHQLKKEKPNSQISIFKNSGHALFVDDPKRFNNLLDKFLKDIL